MLRMHIHIFIFNSSSDKRNLMYKYYFIFFPFVLMVSSFEYGRTNMGWPDSCRNEHQQSPINIKVKSVQPLGCSKPLVFHSEAGRYKFGVARINERENYLLKFGLLLRSLQPTLTGGILGENTYLLQEIQFFWDGEHKIDGESYMLEVQFFFYNKKFNNIDDALGKVDGLAVVSKIYDHDYQDRPGDLGPVINFLEKNGTLTMDDFNLDSPDYYTYTGSLVRPPCTENVRWIINTEKKIATIDQRIRIFNYINKKIPKNAYIRNVEREIQPLNGRPIYKIENANPVCECKC